MFPYNPNAGYYYLANNEAEQATSPPLYSNWSWVQTTGDGTMFPQHGYLAPHMAVHLPGNYYISVPTAPHTQMHSYYPNQTWNHWTNWYNVAPQMAVPLAEPYLSLPGSSTAIQAQGQVGGTTGYTGSPYHIPGGADMYMLNEDPGAVNLAEDTCNILTQQSSVLPTPELANQSLPIFTVHSIPEFEFTLQVIPEDTPQAYSQATQQASLQTTNQLQDKPEGITQPQAKAQTIHQPQAESQTIPQAIPEPQPTPQAKSKATPQAIPEPMATHLAKSQAKQPQAELQPRPQAIPQLLTKLKATPKPQVKPQDMPQAIHQPQTITLAIPQPQPRPQAVPQPLAKPKATPKPQVKPQDIPQAILHLQTITQIIPQPQPRPQAIPQPLVKPKATPKPQNKPQDIPQAIHQPQPRPQAIPQATPQPLEKPQATPQPQPKPQAIPQPQYKLQAIQQSQEKLQATSNFCFEVCPGFQLKNNTVLSSASCQYQVEDFVGSGTFGQVVKCRRKGTSTIVAIKILKTPKEFKHELAVLKHLVRSNIDGCNIVRLLDSFQYKETNCLVFNLYHQSLRDLLTEKKIFSLQETKLIIQQVAVALRKLKSVGIIHSDLKPDNIMLVDQVRYPYKIKVIDFGGGRESTKVISSSATPLYVQSRYYRSPEVVLGVPINEAIDMWSLGCIMAELILGSPLFPANSEYDLIRYIIDLHGLPDNKLLDAGRKTTTFFNRHMYSNLGIWRLKKPAQYKKETSIQPRECRKFRILCLADIPLVNRPTKLLGLDREAEDRKDFNNLLRRMLEVNPAKRIDPSEVIEHHYLTNLKIPQPLHPPQAGPAVSCHLVETAQTQSAQHSHAVGADQSASNKSHGLTSGASRHKAKASKRSSESCTSQEAVPCKIPAYGPACNMDVSNERGLKCSSGKAIPVPPHHAKAASISSTAQKGKAKTKSRNPSPRHKAAPYSKKANCQPSASDAIKPTISTLKVPSEDIEQVEMPHKCSIAVVSPVLKFPKRSKAKQVRREAAPYMKPDHQSCGFGDQN